MYATVSQTVLSMSVGIQTPKETEHFFLLKELTDYLNEFKQ